MKKLFIYRNQTPKSWLIFKLHIYRALGYKIFIWGESNISKKYLNSIKFPPSSYCTEYQHDARALAANYFKKHANRWTGNIYREDYIRKTIDISVTDYYAFEKTIIELIGPKDQVKRISPSLLYAIYHSKLPSFKLWIVLYYPFWVIKLTLVLVRSIILSMISKNKIKAPPIIYIRKKVYPDMGEINHLFQALNNNDSKKIIGIYPFAGRIEQKYGFYFISSMKGMFLKFLYSYMSSLWHCFSDLNFYLKNGVDHNIFRAYFFDTFKAKLILSLSASIICGQLLDKPVYILLSKYKRKSTKVVSLNESFRFLPNRSFDFNHLDKYYSMNKIDEDMQNIYGGNIKSFKQVEFFRKGNATELTKDLADAIQSHKYSIVLATGQVFVERSGFNFWAYDELEKFMKVSLSLSKLLKDVLFIVKGKKGELKLLPRWFELMVNSSTNIYVINSDRPRDLKFNNFEAVIDKVDLLISSAHISTTIWQAISRNKSVIAVNDVHPPSILSEFNGYECNLAELHTTILYWMSLSKSEVYESTEEMKIRFNIGNSDGLNQISTDLQTLSNQN